MTTLKYQHFSTLTLNEDFPNTEEIGEIPTGIRRIAPVTGGTFTEVRLSGIARDGAERPEAEFLVRHLDPKLSCLQIAS